jgi:TonB family protein
VNLQRVLRPSFFLVCYLLFFSKTSLLGADTKGVSLFDAANHAVQQSQLTLPGSPAFHLRAKVVESTNPTSGYQAELEVMWVSPEKWRRTVISPDFSQILIVNGEQRSEQLRGNYYPLWLRNLVTALLDPLPMLPQLKNVSAQIAPAAGGREAQSCSRLQMKVGIPPAQNSAFLVFCFNGAGLLQSVVTPGYSAEFKDYKPFLAKQVARRVVADPEPGTTLEATITELTELQNPDNKLFQIDQPTPREQLVASAAVSEETARSLSLKTADIQWPPVRDGKISGVLSIYVSVDREGVVREAWPLNSDNPQLDDAARQQVLAWRFKPATNHGTPTQLESILTFSFDTKIANPTPVLTDAEARKLATHMTEAHVTAGSAPSGSTFRVRISLDESGKLMGVSNPDNLKGPLFMAAYAAVREWQFRPYVQNGKPDRCSADIVFRVP